MPAPAHGQLHAVSLDRSGRSATRDQEELCIGAVRGHGGVSPARCHRQLCPVVGDPDGTVPDDAGAEGQGNGRDVPSGVRSQFVAGLRHGVCEIVGWGWTGSDQDCGPQDHLMLSFHSSKLRRHVSAMAVWGINVILSAAIFPLLLEDRLDAMVSVDMARAFFWFVTIQATCRQALVYARLFGMTRLRVSMSCSSSSSSSSGSKSIICGKVRS